MSRHSIPISRRVARTLLPAALAFGLAAVLATAGLRTRTGDSAATPGIGATQDWIGSGPAVHGPALLTTPQAVIPPFGAPQTFAVGLAPTGIATSDFDHDDNQDVATSNSLSDDVATLAGAGDGTFGAAAFYPVGFEPSGIATGHFNADAHIDIVTSNSATDDVSLLLGNGDGTFQMEVFFPVGAFPFAILAGDYNEDGLTDVVTANAFFDDMSVLLGNGDGTFQPELFFPTGAIPISLAQGDYNGDQNIDIAVVNLGDETVSVLPGNGDGTFGADTGPFSVALAPGTMPEPASIATADFNGDTFLDLVTANVGTDEVVVLFGNGDGTFQTGVSHPVGDGPLSVTVADFDGNGTADLATADVASSTILLGNGDGTFMMAQTVTVDIEPFVVFASDVNGDGAPDLILGNTAADSISILLNQFNAPPVADAGDDRTIECAAPAGSAVTLDGSGSTDPDGDALTYVWTGPFPEGGGTVEGVAPVVTLAPGVSEIALVVSDGTLDSEPDTVAITVADTVAPVLTGSFAPMGSGWKGGKGGGHDDDDDGGHHGDDDDDGGHHGDDDDDDGGHHGDDDDDGDDRDEDVLLVEFAATDACDPSPTVAAALVAGICQPVPVTSGQLIEYERKKRCKTSSCGHGGVIEIEGPSLTLRVTGSDASGNEAAPLDVLYVPQRCDDVTGAGPAGIPAPQQPQTTPRKAPKARAGGR